MVYPENIGKHLSIDEVALSQGELYTVVTNKKAKGRVGSIVAIIAGTKSEDVIKYLRKIPETKRRKVEEITLDMAGSMKLIAKSCFGRATRVIDRFHVQQLATEAVQEIRIKYRWQAIDQENETIQRAKKQQLQYRTEIYSNGDSRKQLLQGAGFFSLRVLINGLHHNKSELAFYLRNIPKSKKRMIYLIN